MQIAETKNSDDTTYVLTGPDFNDEYAAYSTIGNFDHEYVAFHGAKMSEYEARIIFPNFKGNYRK